jgi:hypothetical protein
MTAIPESDEVAVQTYIDSLRNQMLDLARAAGVPESVATDAIAEARLDDAGVIRSNVV